MKDVPVKNLPEKAKKQTPKKVFNKRKRDSEKKEKVECNDSPKNGNKNDEKENSSGSGKLDAFQFMMNSRHRSIGRNSPGRELSLDDTKDESSTQNLKARKSRLQNWAAQKGAAKRKRDEEIENTIAYKLEKREKRMRKMLNVDCQSDDEVITKRKKKYAVIESDEDDEKEENEEKVKKKRHRLSLNKQVSDVKLTPKSVKAWKFKIKLCMDENADLGNEKELKSEVSVESSYSENAAQSENFTEGESSQHENATQSESSHSENATQSESLQAENATPNETFQSDKVCQGESSQGESSHGEIAVQSESPHNADAIQNELQEENADFSVGELSHSESEPENVDHTDTVVEIEGDVSKADDSVVTVEEKLEDLENSTKRVLRTRRSKPKIYDDFVSDSDDEDLPKNRKNAKREVKMAPVFLKSVPKPKVDPKVIEARREFLMSGVPSSLKKEIEKQQCLEDIEFDVFPSISHIQQKSLDSHLWHLPKPELKLREPEIDQIEIKPFCRNLLNLEKATCVNTEERICPNKIKNCKRIIKELKTQNPDYPVYKMFNSINAKKECRTEQVVENSDKVVPRRRGRPRKVPEKKTETKMVKIDVKQEDTKHALWTEKYKPRSSSDIIGNYGSISLLKKWLTNWIAPKKHANSDSESEFSVTDSDSRDSARFYGNTVILKGPSGSGKTAAVYALCSEFGFDVLEVNASSKRTGKRLLQEVQEATQSHQVCKRNPLGSFINDKEKVVKSSTKMCVLLIEDVDLVFDQDEGFTAALSQIITTSKRPIILTTTDEPSSSIQKVLNNYETINFRPLSSILAIWLQIVCLVEGLYVHVKALDELLSWNRGDIRRTLLQLQLYVNSGGQLYKNDDKTRTELAITIENYPKTDDDNSNLSDLRLDESCESRETVQVHYDCLMGHCDSSSWSDCKSLEVIWWNFPSILSTPNLAKVRLERSKTDVCGHENEVDKRKLQVISDCYDSLAYADVMCGKSQFCDTLGPRWRTRTKDGLGLDESACGYRDCDLDEELALTLLNGRIEAYRKKYGESEVSFGMAVPEPTERRWRSKQFSCEDKLQMALLQCDSLARRSLALDYMPYLRTIAKLDFERASSNAKRGNRFYSHLKSLGVRCGDATYRVASEVFQTWN